MRLWVTLGLIGALGCADRTSAYAQGLAINNDWPKVADECGDVVSPPPPPPPPDAWWKRTIACASGVFTARPVHPTVKTTAPGGGLGVGPTFEIDANNGKWQDKIVGTAARSFSGFWFADVAFRATHDAFGRGTSARDRFAIDVYNKVRSLPELPFYGLGPNSSLGDLGSFSERDDHLGVDLFNPFSANLAAGARVESIWTSIADETGSGITPLSVAFTEATAPGLTTQPNLIHLQAYVKPRPARHVERADYTVSYDAYVDHGTGHYSFQRFEINGSHTIHFTDQVESFLTITDRVSFARASTGHAVPFFLQETLGGSDIDNSPSLRGFKDYRFRGPDLATAEVSYDQHVWAFIGAVGFYDFGQVATRISEFSSSHLRQSYGLGVTVWAGDRVWLRASWGYSAAEGRHFYLGIPAF